MEVRDRAGAPCLLLEQVMGQSAATRRDDVERPMRGRERFGDSDHPCLDSAIRIQHTRRKSRRAGAHRFVLCCGRQPAPDEIENETSGLGRSGLLRWPSHPPRPRGRRSDRPDRLHKRAVRWWRSVAPGERGGASGNTVGVRVPLRAPPPWEQSQATPRPGSGRHASPRRAIDRRRRSARRPSRFRRSPASRPRSTR